MRVVVFDVMDTLLHDPYREAYEAATGLTFDAFQALGTEAEYRALERSEIDEAAYWSVVRRAGAAVDEDRFHATRRAGYGWLPGMRDLLMETAARDRVILSSNYPAGWIADVRARFFDDVPVEVCGSSELGACKPEPAFFEGLADRFGLDPGTTVLVDDVARNVDGAVAAGWHAILHHDATSTREALDALVRGAADPRPGSSVSRSPD
jgi:HAD superfamily hydrolase (TIGR01509 family)